MQRLREKRRRNGGPWPGARPAPARPSRWVRQHRSRSSRRRASLVEAADVQQGAPADQHAGGVDVEHVADLVVLALVDLVVLDRGHRPARPVDQELDLLEPVGVGPGDELGAEDGGAWAGLGLGQQPAPGPPARGRSRRAAATASPSPRSGSRRADITARPNCPLTAMTASSPRRERAQSALPSVEPVSTTRTSSIRRSGQRGRGRCREGTPARCG